MAKASGLVVANNSVSQTVDLEELLGVDLSDYPFLVQAMGQEIVDHIRSRTESKGVDIDGEKFAAYKDSYKKSEVYEAAGKSSKVNMKLRGYMLNSLDFDASGSVVELGLDDEDEAAKAYGHMTGMEGHKHLDGKVAERRFFGINDEDCIDLINRKFSEELDEIRTEKEREEQERDNESSFIDFFTAENSSVATANFFEDDLFGGL